MNKETISKIIRHNRHPIAVHQLWAEFEKLRAEIKALQTKLRKQSESLI